VRDNLNGIKKECMELAKGDSGQDIFAHFFMKGRAGMTLFYIGGLGRGKNARKNSGAILPGLGPSTETTLIRPGQDVGLILLRGSKRVETSQLLKGLSL
jgi:hypothetical protein